MNPIARRQIIFYDIPTGEVMLTSTSGSITKRSQILNYLPTAEISNVGFYYEHTDVEALPHSDLVLFLHNGLPPYLCDSNRIPKTIYLNIKRNRKQILSHKKIKADFEYGMGDQIMQLEVYKKFRNEFPEVQLIAGVDPVYKNIYPYLNPKPTLAPWGFDPAYKDAYRFEMNHQHILWDPRGGTFGKACLFGAELGLDEVHESIDFQMPPAAILSWALKSSIDLTQIQYPLLSIHIHCNSRVTSNWPLSHALNLAHLWHKNTGGSVIFLGDPKRFQFFARWAYYQSFPCDWASTGAIILASSLFVGVDSGPMHLARAAKLNQVFIWGGSGPRDILGRQPQWNDAIGKVPCVDQICCSCPQGRPRCIDETTAADIWKIIESGTFKKWTLTPFPG